LTNSWAENSRPLSYVIVCTRSLWGDQEPHDFRCYVGGGLLFYLAYKRVFACTFDQESPVANPAHEIRFPVADVRLFFNDCRALINIDAVRYFPAPILLAVALALNITICWPRFRTRLSWYYILLIFLS